MKLNDIVSFRKDLLFNGAVQVGWCENDPPRAHMAAEHYVFHGPDYHGVAEDDFAASSHKLIDTASFTLDILKRITGEIADEPFALAIAGYGTGKSHLGVTLSSLLSAPDSAIADKILNNIAMADSSIGQQVRYILNTINQPFLLVTVNGMQDFDLSGEIIRQVLLALNKRGLDTSVLENLRPRFKTAINFTESFFDSLRGDFEKYFTQACNVKDVVEMLKNQNEEAFSKVSTIYKQKMGSPIYAVGKESLHDFIRLTKETYCGPGKPFASIVIIFDEFGRYMEFAVQKPHVAGSGALQQLFECVQAYGDGVFFLGFIQYELKAYISRVASELREDLNRYVTRYDTVRKVRLSTNLETLMSNLLEKRNQEEILRQVKAIKGLPDSIRDSMQQWFPDLKNHAVWMDKERFLRVICQGCWPLHPTSTWMLFKLTSVGKSLQQRSAFSFLADAYAKFQDAEFPLGKTIVPVDLCNEAMINEFLATEKYGQQGATAHAYESVLYKYQQELTVNDILILKAVLISAKIGVKVRSKADYLNVLVILSGLEGESVTESVAALESEYAVLDWNERLCQYEIAVDAVPKRAFISYLESRVAEIDSQTRADIFSQNFSKWAQIQTYNIDFGPQNNIPTREWNYKVYFSNVAMLSGQISYAIRTWRDAFGVDEEKGQLIYCYVGPESNLDAIKQTTIKTIKNCMADNGLKWETGAPIAVIFLQDNDGTFGKRIAELWVLQEQFGEEEQQKYSNYILERQNNVINELLDQFNELERARQILFATEKDIKESRVKNMLSQLFDVIYPERIPFPFDGFKTARGNAARDCQLFVKELFLGNLDRDWIAARSVKTRNRAYGVLNQSWGVIGDDGLIRLKPANKKVRHLIDLLETRLDGDLKENNKPMNMGEMMRVLCYPPYGCNIASGGMLLAVFIGRRKNMLNLYKNNTPIAIEVWLQDAIPKNFLELSVLNVTDIIKISKESLSEWERLLDEWDVETVLLNKVEYIKKARDLEKRIPIPQKLYYKFMYLSEQSNEAITHLTEFDKIVGLAVNKVEKGIEKDNVGLLSWGAAELNDLYIKIQGEKEKWANGQIEEVETYLARARLQIQQRFKAWLKHQVVTSIEHLSKFKFNMTEKIGKNLEKLSFLDEQQLLIEHVEQVDKHVHFIADIKRIASDIDNMVQSNVVTDSTPISVLNNWLEQVQEFAKRLEEAKKRASITLEDIKSATHKLADFQKGCKAQLVRNHERMTNIYNIDQISTLSEISNWRFEIASLISIYDGQEQDVEDLKLVQKHLDLIEASYKRISDENLSEKEFDTLCKECIKEVEKAFLDDAPPLDNDLIFDSIIKTVKSKRERLANDWMRHNVPNLISIDKLSATKTIEIKTQLQKMPRVLSAEQYKLVVKAIEACENRLDELEIEGLLAKFIALSEVNKKVFLNKVMSIFKEVH
ncbi:hypothetical protein [Desulfolucanica intricata]|uniref:hypothetical protein n=1 Tax=Desulfolucanica intricata TaxID=1285191 RepID=UPI00082D6538|nr:hypothetical protein [Desulfolucanica intricata]